MDLLNSFNSTKLINGLTVLTYKMPYLRSVAISLLVKVGSRHEDLAESGLAHFLEHMAFKGTEQRSARDIAEQFDAIGGNFNAYTSKEQTVYHAKVLSEHSFKALEILSDILQNSIFKSEDIAKEYEVIKQEMAQTEDNPDELVYENLYKVAFKDQPLGRSILGTPATIAKFDQQSLHNFIKEHYGANNIFLAFAGDVNHGDVVKFAEQLFTQKAKIPKNLQVAHYSGGYHYCDKLLEQTTLALGFQSFAYLDVQKYYHTQIFSLIFGGGISSRLFQHIREDLGLAYAVGSANSSYCDNGLFSIYAATSPEKLGILMNGLIEELKKATEQITEEELIRAKAQITASIYMAEEKSVYKAEEISKNFAIFGKHVPVTEILELVLSTNVTDISEIAKLIFASTPTLSIVGTEASIFNYDHFLAKLR